MTSIGRAAWCAAPFICCALALCATPLLAQKGNSSADSTYGPGGKKTTETSSHDGKTYTETKIHDPKGNVRETTVEESGPNGKVTTTDKFDGDGKKISSDRKETDGSGKETGGMHETYKDGVLENGNTWQVDPSNGVKHYKVWDPKAQTYKAVPSPNSIDYVDAQGNLHHSVFNPKTNQFEEVPQTKYIEYEGNQPKQKPSVPKLNAEGKLEIISCAGTGQTIGHIADLKLRNKTNDPISCVVPAMVLESKSEKNQDYICPNNKNVDIGPGETKTVPIDGICGNRHKPPVGKGVTGDLVMNSGDPTIPKNPDCNIPAEHVNDLVRKCHSKYDAVDRLQKDGELKDFPYKDKEKQRDILVQWSTWMDPEICQITHSTPATKDDLKKVVYKQVEENGPMTPETKKKVDEGIDTIFDKVELTTAKAKDLEKAPVEYAGTSTVGSSPGVGQTYEIADNTPTPGTEEKKKKGQGKGGKKKKNKYLQKFNWWQNLIQKFPFVDWLEKKMKAGWADDYKDSKADAYNDKFKGFLDDKKVYKDLKTDRDAAEQKAKADGATQADKDAFNKLDNQLKKLENEFKQDFNKTDDGKKAMGELHDAEKKADEAHAAEKDAGKNIDQSTKDLVDDYFKNNPPPPELLHPPDPVQAFW